MNLQRLRGAPRAGAAPRPRARRAPCRARCRASSVNGRHAHLGEPNTAQPRRGAPPRARVKLTWRERVRCDRATRPPPRPRSPWTGKRGVAQRVEDRGTSSATLTPEALGELAGRDPGAASCEGARRGRRRRWVRLHGIETCHRRRRRPGHCAPASVARSLLGAACRWLSSHPSILAVTAVDREPELGELILSGALAP